MCVVFEIIWAERRTRYVPSWRGTWRIAFRLSSVSVFVRVRVAGKKRPSNRILSWNVKTHRDVWTWLQRIISFAMWKFISKPPEKVPAQKNACADSVHLHSSVWLRCVYVYIFQQNIFLEDWLKSHFWLCECENATAADKFLLVSRFRLDARRGENGRRGGKRLKGGRNRKRESSKSEKIRKKGRNTGGMEEGRKLQMRRKKETKWGGRWKRGKKR